MGGGNIVWTDKRGKRIAPQKSDSSNIMPAMGVKTGALRWVFLSERALQKQNFLWEVSHFTCPYWGAH